MERRAVPNATLLWAAAAAGEDRKESTYSITSVLQLARPYRFADMNDDYQDARVVAEDHDSLTVEITYYPLNNNREKIGENANWRRDYARMTEYLRPTASENWDEKMRADLIAALKQDGIDPDKLSDKQLVTQVSHWLMKRSRYTNAFAIWFVHFPDGKPEVFPTLRKFFDKEKPTPDWTDQAMFDQEVLGRAMFYNRVHGSCTSSAAYMATVMRALGIPTRIVICVPPADMNDPKQREMLLGAIHHNAVRATIRHGLPSGGGNFSNHLFNEVYVGNHWVRLNYDALGQNILDDGYFGLLTHIMTTDSISHVPLAETWGSRYALYGRETPGMAQRYASMNPYQLLKVSDHFGVNSHIDNPEVDNEELRRVTVTEAYWKDTLPPGVWEQGFRGKDPTGSDFYIGIKEFIPRYKLQMREFEQRAGNHFVLSASGHADLHASLSRMKLSFGDKTGRRYQLFGVRIDPESRESMDSAAEYAIRPVNTSETYVWTVNDGLRLKK